MKRITQETAITLFMDKKSKENIKNAAHDERMGMSEFIRKVLADYIENKKSNQDI